ncbi:thioredoxin family protein [Paenibacillus yanchengensis]|uniref:Thioredoxin family protein n=1 Tax=Paenibacillus yanchengensis TaxID=2035833 RepID=A0ABW4YP44_9BACL
MLELFDRDTIHEKIKQHTLTLLIIKTRQCGVCDVVLQKIEQLLPNYNHIHGFYFYLDNAPDCAADFLAFSAPTVILFADGKEVYRAARFVRFEELSDKLQQYNDLF